MGAAVSADPFAPFTKLNNGNSLQDGGHEVLIWKYYGRVLSLTSNMGKVPNSVTVSGGYDDPFKAVLSGLTNLPAAPGLYRPEIAIPTITGTNNVGGVNDPNKWGISMNSGNQGLDIFLKRFEMEMTISTIPSRVPPTIPNPSNPSVALKPIAILEYILY